MFLLIYLQDGDQRNTQNLGGRPVGAIIVEQKEKKEKYENDGQYIRIKKILCNYVYYSSRKTRTVLTYPYCVHVISLQPGINLTYEK